MVRLFLLLAILLVLPACSQDDSSEQLSHKEYVRELGKLPGLSMAKSKPLREELARLMGENATPELFAVSPPADENNVASSLAEVFTKADLERLKLKTKKLFPKKNDPFGFNKYQMVELNLLIQQQQPSIRKIRQALGKPECDFGIDFNRGYYGINHEENPFLAILQVSVRLYSFVVAKDLYIDKKPNNAVDSVRVMFRLVRLLAKEKHPVPRLHAASLRAESLKVMQAIVQHPQANKKTLNSLYQVLDYELANWPKDRDAWIGDRCFGLHLYEVARNGNLTSILTKSEIEQFKDEGVFDKLDQSVLHNIDEDEAAYLRWMRAIIVHCSETMPQREKVFDQIINEAEALRKGDTFPFIAYRLLVSDYVKKGNIQQVMDLEKCKAWHLGLALAIGKPTPKDQINPHTGVPYQVNINKKLSRVEVEGLVDLVDYHLPAILIPIKTKN